MKSVGIMQPYFMPYIGYWQLMNAVDTYVVYDDVNYIKGGWINRNRILINNEVKYFNIQMDGASSNKLINEVMVSRDKHFVVKDLKILEAAYSKAPMYNNVMPLLEDILKCNDSKISEYILNSFYVVNDYLEIDTEIMMSSTIEKDNLLKGQDKVIDICKILQADEYYNAIGGQSLYSYNDFKNQGIDLKFLKTDAIIYKQFGDGFKENLSMIDVLMFNSREEVKFLLGKYSIV